MTHMNLTDSAYDSILNMILAREIKPGERIMEGEIADQLEISRTPVREAMNQLCQNGFIKSVKRRGLYCVEISEKELLDLIDLRVVLEELSCKKCIEVATQKDIDELYAYVREFLALSPEEKAARHMRSDIGFHIRIATIANSERLTKYIQEVENTLIIARNTLKKAKYSQSVIETSWNDHLELVKAIEARDKAMVTCLNQRHIQLMRSTQVLMQQEE